MPEENKDAPKQKQVEIPLLFAGKYDMNAQVRDPGLSRVINTRSVIVPKTAGRLSQQRLGRTKVNITERLIGHLMVPGHKGKKHLRTSKVASGRYATCFNIVYEAFERLSKEGKNPTEVLIKAIENSAPREEVMQLLIAGQRLAKQVDTSPMRRLDLSLRWMAQGTFQLSFSGKKKAGDALYEILLSASQNSETSFPVSKRIDTERQAASSR